MKNMSPCQPGRHASPSLSAFPLGGWLKLARVLSAESSTDISGKHGELHWRATAMAGNRICDMKPGADRMVVMAFALMHDSMRSDDHCDPGHGHRAAEWARKSALLRRIMHRDQIDLLAEACEGHSSGSLSDDPTIGACWDADRINQVRHGVMPDYGQFSILSGREAIEELGAMMRAAHPYPPSWRDTFLRAQAAIR